MRRALSFLTLLGGPAPPDPSTFVWFPVVGVLVGSAVGGAWRGAGEIWAPPVAAALALLVDAVLTGGLHLDGLADSGDGLLPAMPTERRLAVMADPRIGAFGAITLVVVILARYAALVVAPASVWVVAGLWCASRAAVAVVALTVRYAREDGLASAFLPRPTAAVGSGVTLAVAVAVLGLAIALPLMLTSRAGAGAIAIIAELAVIAGITVLAVRRVGGYTGDVLGAQVVLGETAGLLALAARW
ncbi:MAG: adenosylcobinamide-GDP ribazoletransferase [Pseudonocardiales bacterium]|nr:MAG: adenosylcobinamide-GDP ribazoletransferase [Pseudonocardiales bacterium]